MMAALRALPLLALAAALAVVLSGFGTRFGLWDYRMGFQVLRWGTLAALAVAAVSVLALLVPTSRRARATALTIALVVAGAAAAFPLYLLQGARKVPPINDISTDTANPPAFVAILPLRATAPVPAAYPGAATASAQRAGYPDIRPLVLGEPPAVTYRAALATARNLHWDIVAADPASGRIEATDTTPWFGFRDDIVIRITPVDAGSRVDMRSVSRVGKSDLGVNARRIRDFLGRLAR